MKLTWICSALKSNVWNNIISFTLNHSGIVGKISAI